MRQPIAIGNNDPVILSLVKDGGRSARKCTDKEFIDIFEAAYKLPFADILQLDVNNLLPDIEKTYDKTDKFYKMYKDMVKNAFIYYTSIDAEGKISNNLNYCGMHSTAKGLRYIGIDVNDDEESDPEAGLPVYVILYIDTKDKIRLYIPMYGNNININAMSPLNSEAEGEGYDELDNGLNYPVKYYKSDSYGDDYAEDDRNYLHCMEDIDKHIKLV